MEETSFQNKVPGPRPLVQSLAPGDLSGEAFPGFRAATARLERGVTGDSCMQGQVGNLHEHFDTLPIFSFGFSLKNEKGSFMFVCFSAESSKMSQYHFKYLNLGHRLAHVPPKTAIFLALAIPM